MEALVKKSIALSEEILKQNKKIRRKLFWMSFNGYLKWAFILIPIILGIIYIPPFIEKLPAILGDFFNISDLPVADILKILNEK